MADGRQIRATSSNRGRIAGNPAEKRVRDLADGVMLRFSVTRQRASVDGLVMPRGLAACAGSLQGRFGGLC